MFPRTATANDAAAIAEIYNEGIQDRLATFETRLRTGEDIRNWFDGIHRVIVVEEESRIIAFAATSTYRPRECYSGIAEFSVYVARAARGHGVGRMAMDALIEAAQRARFWKLVSRIFVENIASRKLVASCGFREVGTYQRHARLDGEWRDVVIVERLIGAHVT